MSSNNSFTLTGPTANSTSNGVKNTSILYPGAKPQTPSTTYASMNQAGLIPKAPVSVPNLNQIKNPASVQPYSTAGLINTPTFTPGSNVQSYKLGDDVKDLSGRVVGKAQFDPNTGQPLSTPAPTG